MNTVMRDSLISSKIQRKDVKFKYKPLSYLWMNTKLSICIIQAKSIFYTN